MGRMPLRPALSVDAMGNFLYGAVMLAASVWRAAIEIERRNNRGVVQSERCVP
jgi:hypothetical protein